MTDLSWRDSTLSRRKLLGALGAMGLAGVTMPSLVGCSSSGDPSPGTSVDPNNLGALDIYTWEGYDLEKEMKSWRDAHGVILNASFVGVQDDVATKLSSPSSAGLDLSTANQSFIDYFQSLGIMSPITTEEIPELANLFQKFQGKPWRNDDGTFNSVPWTWGPMGLTYAADRMDAPTSWDAFFEPAMKGRIALLDDNQQHTQLAAAILGYDPSQLTESQLADIKGFLIKVVKQAKTLNATTGDQVSLMQNGEVDLVFLGWTGIDAAAKDKGFKAVTMIPPGERSIGFSDASFIPPDADNRPAALAFSQQLITGEVAAAAAKTFFAAVTNPDVVPLLEPDIAKPYPYDDLDKYFDQLMFPAGYPRGESKYVNIDQAIQMWQEVKAEAL